MSKKIISLHKKILVIIAVILFTISLIPASILSNTQQCSPNTELSLTSITTSMIFYNDSDFLTYGLNGSGTAEDPYKIENLSFEVYNNYSIHISQITKSFIIKNCSFKSNTWCIRVSSVTNATAQIVDNYFDSTYGISIYYTSNFTILNNKVYTDKHSISVTDSDNFNISSNICKEGIGVSYSSRARIFNNTISYAIYSTSIEVRYSTNCYLQNNTVVGSNLVTSLYYVSDTSLQSNFGKDNVAGMKFRDSNNINVTDNIIVSSEMFGMSFREENANCTITYNILINNNWMNLIGSGYQARDDSGVTWNANYWSYWDGGSYEIYSDPIPISSDPNPLTAGDDDNDNLDNYLEEYYCCTNKSDEDTDDDLLLDGEEVTKYHTNPLRNDTDFDGLGDGEEIYTYGTIPTNPDTDGDLLLDGEEVLEFNSNPTLVDSDLDGMDDAFEVFNGLNPNSDDSALDPDEDGLSNILEYIYHTEPQLNDTDGDLLLDGEEVFVYNSLPNLSDTDLDGLGDGEEVLIYGTDPTMVDSDSDGLDDYLEIFTLQTNPLNEDSDFDGIPDKWEVDNSLNPLVDDASEDPDEDKLTNFEEYNYGTSPHDPDTDGDGWLDGIEVRRNTNPLLITDYPLSPKEIAVRVIGITIVAVALVWFSGHIILRINGITWYDLKKRIFRKFNKK